MSFIMRIFAWKVPSVSLIFLKRSLVFPFCCFPLFLCIDHWGRLSYLSLLFFETLLSNGYIFSFLLCLLLLFLSQLFVRSPQFSSVQFSLSHVILFATPWTVAYQAPPSMGFFQARVLKWVAISFSRGSSWPRDRTQVSCIVGRCFTVWATREVQFW